MIRAPPPFSSLMSTHGWAIGLGVAQESGITSSALSLSDTTIAPPAGSARTGAGQSSFRLAGVHTIGVGVGLGVAVTVGLGATTTAGRLGLGARRTGRRTWNADRGLATLDDEECASKRDDRDDHRRGERGSGHGSGPPRRPQGTALTGSMDLVQDGIDDAIGQDLHADGKVGGEEGIGIGAASSCQLLLVEDGRAGIGFESRPDRRGCVGQSGLRRPEGDAEVICDLGQRQPEGVVEDEDGALLRRKSPEAAVQLVAVVDRQELVGGGRCVRLEQDDISREVSATSGLGVAGVDEDPMEPRLEPIEVAQRGELPPDLDEGHLDRVLGEVRVAQDPMRDEDAAVADLTNQGGEGLLVALSRLVHDRSQHVLPPGSRRRICAVNEHECGCCANSFDIGSLTAAAGICGLVRCRSAKRGHCNGCLAREIDERPTPRRRCALPRCAPRRLVRFAAGDSCRRFIGRQGDGVRPDGDHPQPGGRCPGQFRLAATNYGTRSTIRVKEGSSPIYRSYLRFNVAGVTGSVTGLKLRLYVTDLSPNVQSVFPITDKPAWIESGTGAITWNDAPAIGSTLLGSASVPALGYTDIVLNPGAISGNGPLTLAIKGSTGGTNSAIYASREDPTNKPQLLITLADGPADTSPTATGGSPTTTPEDTALALTVAGTDAETCELTFNTPATTTHGTLSIPSPMGCIPGSPNTDTVSLNYTPAADYNGPDSFSYTVTDGAAGTSNPQTVNLTVGPVNDVSIANTRTVSTTSGVPLAISLTGSDVETCELTFLAPATTVAGGTLSAAGPLACVAGSSNSDAASVTYNPPGAGYSGPDSFSFTVHDGTGPSLPGTIAITVSPSTGVPTVITLNPVADAQVNSDLAATNYGTRSTIRVKEGSSPIYRSYLRFNVAGVTGSVTGLKLRLYVTDLSPNVQSVFPITDKPAWIESGTGAITWNDAPAIGSTLLGFGQRPGPRLHRHRSQPWGHQRQRSPHPGHQGLDRRDEQRDLRQPRRPDQQAPAPDHPRADRYRGTEPHRRHRRRADPAADLRRAPRPRVHARPGRLRGPGQRQPERGQHDRDQRLDGGRHPRLPGRQGRSGHAVLHRPGRQPAPGSGR